MGRPKAGTAYKRAVDKLREKHAKKIEDIFLKMYDVVMNPESDKRDAVNASKVCASILGVPKPPTERSAPPKPVGAADLSSKPALSDAHRAALDELLNK